MCTVRSSIISATMLGVLSYTSTCFGALQNTTWQSSSSNSSGVTFTYSPSPTNPDAVFIFCIANIGSSSSAVVTSASYGGASATQIGSNVTSSTSGNNGDIAAFYYDNSSGSKNGNQIVNCSRSGSGQFAAIVVGYTGTDIALPPKFNSNGSSTNVSSFSVNVTGLDSTYADYQAIAGIYTSQGDQSGVTVGTGFTKNSTSGVGYEDLGTRIAISMYDYVISSGSTSKTCNYTTSSNNSQVLFCLVLSEETGKRRRFISN